MTDPFTERVLSALASVKRIPPERITLESSLQDLEFDSLDTTVLLFELEKQFQISISDDEARSIRCVRDIVEGVARLLPGGSLDPATSGG